MAASVLSSTPQRASGFVLVLLLAFLPALISAFILLSSVGLILTQLQQSLHLCRSQLLSLQGQLKSPLIELLNLNPQAQQTRAARKVAQEALRLALKSGNPQAIALASTQWRIIQAQEQQLFIHQQVLLKKAQYQRWRLSLDLSHQLSQRPGVDAVFRNPPRVAGLALEPHPASDKIPDYRPMADFSRLQSESFSWTLNLQRIYPQWIQRWLEGHSPTWTIRRSCSASLQQEGGTWKTRLMAN